MPIQNSWSLARPAGLLLALGCFVFLPGGVMFMLRGGTSGGAPPSPAYSLWERGWVMAAAVVSSLSLLLLAGHLQATSGRTVAGIAAAVYLVAGIVLVAAEVQGLRLGYATVYPWIVAYVVLAFLSQAAMGLALLQSGAVPGWTGWATIAWNLAWLVLLPITSPRDIYFPALHHFMPLVIGIALLWPAA